MRRPVTTAIFDEVIFQTEAGEAISYSTKSLKRDSIYKFCLWIIEEHSCLTLKPLHVSKLRCDAYAQEYTLFLPCAESDNTYILYLGILEEHNCLI